MKLINTAESFPYIHLKFWIMCNYMWFRIRGLLFFLLFFLFSNYTQAQLGFKNVNYTSPDSLLFGDTIFVNAELFNYNSNVPFNGVVNFMASVNGSLTTLIPDTGTYAINPASSKLLNFKLPVTSPLFKVGPDVVIIWPLTTVPTHDSVSKNIWVRYPLGISNELRNSFSAYRRGGSLILDIADNSEEAQRVRIYSLIGSVIYEHSGRIPLEIPLQDKQPGIYLCEVLWKNNTRKVVRFLLD